MPLQCHINSADNYLSVPALITPLSVRTLANFVLNLHSHSTALCETSWLSPVAEAAVGVVCRVLPSPENLFNSLLPRSLKDLRILYVSHLKIYISQNAHHTQCITNYKTFILIHKHVLPRHLHGKGNAFSFLSKISFQITLLHWPCLYPNCQKQGQ